MKFEEFEAGFMRENRKLKLYFLGIVGILVICLTLIATQRRYFVYSGGEVFKERLLAVDVCLEGFTQVVEERPTSHFISDGIISILKNDPFTLKVDGVQFLREVENGKCRLIVKSKGKLFSFLITLKGSDSFPFFYKVNQIDQEEVTL